MKISNSLLWIVALIIVAIIGLSLVDYLLLSSLEGDGECGEQCLEASPLVATNYEIEEQIRASETALSLTATVDITITPEASN